MSDGYAFEERKSADAGAPATAGPSLCAAAPSHPAEPGAIPPGRSDYIPIAADAPLWVFGYGSLMWNPGFAYERSEPALLVGYHRKFCVYSFHYRGTPERPGLVLGLDRGGSCRGLAFRVAPGDVSSTLAYLWDREMISAVYRPAYLPIRLAEGRVRACTFVAERHHPQYSPLTCLDAMARLISDSRGCNGPNCDYLFNTVEHLDALGIRDTPVHQLADRVRAKAPLSA